MQCEQLSLERKNLSFFLNLDCTSTDIKVSLTHDLFWNKISQQSTIKACCISTLEILLPDLPEYIYFYEL